MYHSECIHFYNGLRLEYSLHLHFQCHADRKCNCNNFYFTENKNYYESVSGAKYVEVLSIVCVAAQFNTDQFPDQNYNVLINRQIYDPNHLGDQKLLSASGYYGSGWRVSLSVSSKASYHNYGSGMILNGIGGNPVYRIVIATL